MLQDDSIIIANININSMISAIKRGMSIDNDNW